MHPDVKGRKKGLLTHDARRRDKAVDQEPPALLAYRYLDSRRDEITKDAEIEVHGGVGWLRRGTSVIAVPDHWHDGDKVTVRISKKNDNDNENENQ